MDRRSWPWKKKSSNKAAVAESVSDSAITLSGPAGSQIDQVKKEEYKKPKYVQISVETYSHLTELEDQVKSYEEQITTLEEEIKDLNEKLLESQSEMTNKENLVKQHAKVAEEAVSGWEKAEAEAAALKGHLESVTLLKLTAEDRSSHLDGALKECMKQIRNLKEEHEEELRDIVFTKTKQFDKAKLELESRIAALDKELLRSTAENSTLSRSLQDCSTMLIKLNDEKSQAEAEIELLKGNIESNQKEINSLKYEIHIVTKEMEIRNEEKNMSVRSAEVANKQHLEGINKITKLEAECQRLRGLVRKKLPGPAALAQMKLEVENFSSRDHGDTRLRRSPVKPPTPHVTSVPEFSLDTVQKCQKENGLLTDRLLVMEEETKMLKEALALRNSELQASRSICAKTASKLQTLEAQLQANSEHGSPPKLHGQLPVSQNTNQPPSLTSLSVDASDDGVSCAGSSSTPLVSELSYFKKEIKIESPHKYESVNRLDLMDDFLEMEKLAYQSNKSPGALSGTDFLNDEKLVSMSNGHSIKVIDEKESLPKEQIDSYSLASQTSSNGWTPGPDPEMGVNLVKKLQSRVSVIIDSLSKAVDSNKTLEDLRCVVQEVCEKLCHQSLSCVAKDSSFLTAAYDCKKDAVIDSEKDIFLSNGSENLTQTSHSIGEELAAGISQIYDFVIVLGKEAKAVQATSFDSEGLSLLMETLSITYKEVMKGEHSLIRFVFDLSHLISKVNMLHFNVVGCKLSEAETNSPACIDKVVLPENKASVDASDDRYTNGCTNFSDTNSDPDMPTEGSPPPTSDLMANSWKCSLEEFEQLKLEKDNLITNLSSCMETLRSTKIQLQETEQHLAEVKSQLTSAQKLNGLSETQLKCMAESYKTLEMRAEDLQAEINRLQAKVESLGYELQEERSRHRDVLSRCKDLEDQLHRIQSCPTMDADAKTNQERELAAAADKLAECQETIFLLGKQLNALRPQTESASSPHSDRSKSEGFYEEPRGIINTNWQDIDQAESDMTSTMHLRRSGGDSPIEIYNALYSPDSGGNNPYFRSPSSSKHPTHRSSKSASSTSSSPTPEKHSRGLSRFFS